MAISVRREKEPMLRNLATADRADRHLPLRQNFQSVQQQNGLNRAVHIVRQCLTRCQLSNVGLQSVH